MGRLLEPLVHELHHDRSQLRHSDRLGELLMRLYDGDADPAWAEAIEPFVDRERHRLEVIYSEHANLRTARCLDDYEGLAVIERLRAVPDRVTDEWPLDPGELHALADLAGVRVARF